MSFPSAGCAFFRPFPLLRKKDGVFSGLKRYLSTTPVRSADDRKRPRAVQLSYSVYESTKPITGDVACPVLILHGLYGSKTNWHSQAKAILAKTGRKVITADLRNHGESPHHQDFNFDVMKDDVLSLLDELRIAKATLVGHSLGGRVVMTVALTQPEYVDQLVVVDISPFTSSPNAISTSTYAAAMKKVQLPTGVPLSKVRKLVHQALAPVVQSPSVRDFLVTNLAEGPDNSFHWKVNLDSVIANQGPLFTFPAYSTSYSGPTLFIGGEKSDYIRRDEHDVIKQQLFPKAEFQYIPDAGHWVHAEKSKEFLEVLCSFLQDKTR